VLYTDVSAPDLQDLQELKDHQREGSPLTQKIVQDYVKRAARRANVEPAVHRPRHTFCSHVAMRGAPARAIQERAGHMDLATIERYMHLCPAAIEGAIRLLDQPRPVPDFGDSLETAGRSRATCCPGTR